MNITHGYSNHRLYNVWINMINRCSNPTNGNYVLYGARGISVCKEWHDIKNFIDDMYPTFEEGLTLDRIDVNGNYEKENCRWCNATVQNRNTRQIYSHNKTGYRGVSLRKDTNKYRAFIKINLKQITIGCFNTALEAAKAYDQYVINNNLEHTINGVNL